MRRYTLQSHDLLLIPIKSSVNYLLFVLTSFDFLKMHELSVAENLLKMLEKLRKEKNISVFLKINITVNPLSCIDEDNINFTFHSLTKDNPVYKDAQIYVKRSADPSSKEFVLENVEIEELSSIFPKGGARKNGCMEREQDE